MRRDVRKCLNREETKAAKVVICGKDTSVGCHSPRSALTKYPAVLAGQAHYLPQDSVQQRLQLNAALAAG
jgi:hypothetical protein